MQIMDSRGLKYSAQFVEFALKYNSRELVEQFAEYRKNYPNGGGDLNVFLLNGFKGKLLAGETKV